MGCCASNSAVPDTLCLDETISTDSIVVWNQYIEKYSQEPTDASQLVIFSNISYDHARKIYNRNSGKGMIKQNGTSDIDILREQLRNVQRERDSLQHRNDYLQHNYDILSKQKNIEECKHSSSSSSSLYSLYHKESEEIVIQIKQRPIDPNPENTEYTEGIQQIHCDDVVSDIPDIVAVAQNADHIPSYINIEGVDIHINIDEIAVPTVNLHNDFISDNFNEGKEMMIKHKNKHKECIILKGEQQKELLIAGFKAYNWTDSKYSWKRAYNIVTNLIYTNIECEDISSNIMDYIISFLNQNAATGSCATLDSLSEFVYRAPNKAYDDGHCDEEIEGYMTTGNGYMGKMRSNYCKVLLDMNYDRNDDGYCDDYYNGMQRVSRLLTGQRNDDMCAYLVDGYLREYDVPMDIHFLIKLYSPRINPFNKWYLNPLDLNWGDDVKGISDKICDLLMNVIDGDQQNVGWKCVFVRCRCFYYDCYSWYLWWFVDDGNKTYNKTHCMVMRFSKSWCAQFEETSSSESAFYDTLQ